MKHILKPTVIKAAGNPPKQIEEFIGRAQFAYFRGQHCENDQPRGMVGAR